MVIDIVHPSRTRLAVPDPQLLHVRARLTTEHERERVGEVTGGALHALSIPEPVHLEFWDSRPPVPETASKLRLRLETHGETRASIEVGKNNLPHLLEAFAAVSFGLWLGVPTQNLPTLLAHKANSDRARALPVPGAFVVCSLYDDNVEIFARLDDPTAAAERLRRYASSS